MQMMQNYTKVILWGHNWPGSTTREHIDNTLREEQALLPLSPHITVEVQVGFNQKISTLQIHDLLHPMYTLFISSVRKYCMLCLAAYKCILPRTPSSVSVDNIYYSFIIFWKTCAKQNSVAKKEYFPNLSLRHSLPLSRFALVPYSHSHTL